MMTRREKIRKSLSPIYIPFYDIICKELDGIWQPYQGRRTFTEQDALWMQGRTLPGKIVTNAKGGESAHNYGCATDWALFDGKRFDWPPASDRVWNEFGNAVEKAGLIWGGLWKMQDSPHAELRIKARWGDVIPYYQEGGESRAEEFIRSVMI